MGSDPSVPNLTDFDLKLLRIFRAVVQAQGLAPAQENLGLSLSTISIKLKQLEERLGFTLCERGRKGFALTSEGERIYQSLGPLFDSIMGFREVIADVRGNLTGDLHLGFVDALATYDKLRFDEVLRRYADVAPDVRLHFDIRSPQELYQGLVENRYHVIVTPVEPERDSINADSLFTEVQSLYCGRQHALFDETDPVAIRAAVESAIFCDKNYEGPSMLGHHDSRVGPSVGHMESASMLILSGRYLGYLPIHYAETWVRAGLMRELLPTEYAYVTQFYLGITASPPSRMVEAFRRCMLETLACS